MQPFSICTGIRTQLSNSQYSGNVEPGLNVFTFVLVETPRNLNEWWTKYSEELIYGMYKHIHISEFVQI